MTRTGIVLTLVLLLAGPLAADDKPSLKEYAARLQSRRAYGVYIKDQKIGWTILDVKLGKHDGKDVLISVEEMLAEMKRGDLRVKMETKTTTTFALDGAGEILLHEDLSRESGRETLRRGVRKGDRFEITVSTAPKRIRSVALPKKNILATRKLEEWLRSGPKKGATFASYGLALDETDIDFREDYTFQSKKSLTVGGVSTDVFHVLVKAKGALSDMEVLSDGTPLRATLGGFLDLRTEPEAIAKKVTEVNFDLLDLAAIPADRDLGDPDRVESLTLEVAGLGKYALPVSHRQTLKVSEGKDLATLLLKRDFKPEKEEPLTTAQRKSFLEPTPRVQCDEEKVKEQAKTIVGKETNVHEKARLLTKWVFVKVRKSFSDNPSTTLEVMDRMAGDCKHHALLFVSLARAAGIPAREVGGVGYCGPGTKSFGWHAWAEYHDGHQWVSVDPTWHQDHVDATHVKFSDSAEDMAWVNVLGKVKFKVIEVDRKKK